MSDLFEIKQLDGYKTIFLRFADPDHFVIEVNGVERIVAREVWRSLPVLSAINRTRTEQVS
jgi:hypothetical protein